jgi:beta-glucanase (GH16 family)
MHGPGDAGAYDLSGNVSLADAGALADDFHVYAIEWDQTAVHFFFDQTEFETRVPTDLPVGEPWVFDHPFFLILNVAVGGNWPGNPNASTQFPQQMLVDYVRVYAKAM